jgi:predicted DNA-binding transcriptional regulator AlpA
VTRDELRATPAITVEQGCAFLQISRSHWYALEKAGELPTHRLPPLGRQVRWCGETLAKYGTPEDIAKRRRAHLLKSA